jgi:preprotein translocase subunit YajC
MALMFAVFYFLLIRPQQKRAKEHASMINQLQKGDEVITRGGLIGKISGVKDDELVIELQEKVRVRVKRAYVEGKVAAAKTTAKSDDKKADKGDKDKDKPEPAVETK